MRLINLLLNSVTRYALYRQPKFIYLLQKYHSTHSITLCLSWVRCRSFFLLYPSWIIDVLDAFSSVFLGIIHQARKWHAHPCFTLCFLLSSGIDLPFDWDQVEAFARQGDGSLFSWCERYLCYHSLLYGIVSTLYILFINLFYCTLSTTSFFLLGKTILFLSILPTV